MSTPSDTCSSSNDESGVPEVKCSVSNVTVFLDRSMITRKGTIALTKSTKRVHLSGFPVDDLDADTMRVGCEGTGALRILDFKLSKKTHTDIPDDVIANLEKKKLDLEDTLQDIQDKVDVVQHQIKFVEKIPADQKAEHGTLMRRVEPKEWKNLVEYMSDELNDLHARKRKLERSMRNLRLSLNAVSAELVRHQGARKRTRQRVTVDVCVDEDGEYEFDVSHLCYSARWHPTYDARVNSLNKSIELSYLGVVTQNTGEDWIDVQIMLSTASPHLGGTAPVLNAWYIKEYIQLTFHVQNMSNCELDGPMRMCLSAPPPPPLMCAAPKKMARYVEAEVQQGHGSNVVFRPSGQNSIPTGEEPTKLLIMRCEVGNEFNFITVPKRGEKVYLNAAVTNTSEYPLLSGPISLFLDNSFVGYALLSRMVLPSETFDLQLGVDESIRVVYKLKNKSSGERKGIFSKNKTEEYAYEILLESFRECDEVVIVRDQIPVSQDERIKVDVLEKIPSESEEKNEDDLQKGVVEWRVVLNARKKSRIQLAYRVSYPPEITVTGL